MTVPNIRQMSESSEVEEGRTATAAIGSTYASAAGSPVEEGEGGEGGALEEEKLTLRRLKLAHI